VFRRNCRHSDRYFTVLAHRDPGSPGRLGLAVSKKQARRAVDRNRLKRLIREAFRRRHPVLAGFDLVVMVRHTAVSRSNADLDHALGRLFDQVADPPATGTGQR
jgi:ribonuclease P protein component